MAATQRSHVKLFHELKQICPGVSDEVVNTCMQQGIAPLNRVLPCDSFVRATTVSSLNNIGWRLTYDENGNDKEKCLQVLQSESHFGPRSQSEPHIHAKPRVPVDTGRVQVDPRIPGDSSRPHSDGGHVDNDLLSHRLQEVHITHENSAAETRPGYHRYISYNRDTGADIQTSISWPSDLMHITDPGKHSPNTAPVMPHDFSPFVQQNLSKSPQQIPNINCTAYVGGADSSGNASPQSAGSPAEGRRAVPVHHYPSRSPTTVPAPVHHNQQYVYRIQMGDGGGLCTVAPQSQALQTHLQSLSPSVNQQCSPEVSPGGGGGGGGSVGQPFSVSPTTNPASSQYSSQATIYINKNNNNNNGQMSPEMRQRNKQYPQQFPRDPRWGLHQHQMTQVPSYPGVHQIPANYAQPLSVTIRAAGPEGVETKVHYVSPDRTGYQVYGAHSPTRFVETDSGRHLPLYPTMSPASSQSSLSSESSRSDVMQRQRSGSMQEEIAYTQALLCHQHSRMDRLKNDYRIELQKLDKLRTEVSQMEKNMLERRSLRRNSFPAVDDITKMRQTNRKMQTDIQVMVNEIDMYKNGQTPLGVIDPHGQQNFFKNIPTGQRNSIYSHQPRSSRGSESPPPIPPRDNLSYVPPAPPTQRPTGSGDSEEGEQWSCSECTLLNHPALNKCECCEMPRAATGS